MQKEEDESRGEKRQRQTLRMIGAGGKGWLTKKKGTSDGDKDLVENSVRGTYAKRSQSKRCLWYFTTKVYVSVQMTILKVKTTDGNLFPR